MPKAPRNKPHAVCRKALQGPPGVATAAPISDPHSFGDITMKTRCIAQSWLGVAAVCAMLLVAAMAAQAQTGPLAISNNTACSITFCSSNGCITVGPNSSVTIQVPCSGKFALEICGVRQIIGPGHTFLSNVNVGGCCADVALSPGFVACTWFLSIDPAAGPCPC